MSERARGPIGPTVIDRSVNKVAPKAGDGVDDLCGVDEALVDVCRLVIDIPAIINLGHLKKPTATRPSAAIGNQTKVRVREVYFEFESIQTPQKIVDTKHLASWRWENNCSHFLTFWDVRKMS